MTYRRPDEARTREADDRRRAREADEAADVRAMRNPWRPLRQLVPEGSPRRAVCLAGVALGFPPACTVVGSVDALADIAAWTALVVGFATGLLAIGFGIAALATRETGRLASTAAIFAGLFALPWTLVCAFVASGGLTHSNAMLM